VRSTYGGQTWYKGKTLRTQHDLAQNFHPKVVSEVRDRVAQGRVYWQDRRAYDIPAATTDGGPEQGTSPIWSYYEPQVDKLQVRHRERKLLAVTYNVQSGRRTGRLHQIIQYFADRHFHVVFLQQLQYVSTDALGYRKEFSMKTDEAT